MHMKKPDTPNSLSKRILKEEHVLYKNQLKKFTLIFKKKSISILAFSRLSEPCTEFLNRYAVFFSYSAINCIFWICCAH